MKECGISCWHPQWLQKFANTRWFMIVYGLLGTIQATSHLYFVVTLTTIEKRFKIPSQTTGIILSGNEVSQIMLSLILTYFGGQRNRPRWIAWGVVFSALSCFILACPHYIYGAGDEAFQYTKEYTFENVTGLQSKPINLKTNKLCKSTNIGNDECEEVFSYVPLILIFMSQFVLGIGNTLYYSLGQSYLDDNTKQGNTPLVLAYAFSMRMFGPILGFGLAYSMLDIYIDPRFTPLITSNDPRWLGAYWLGWNILGTFMLLFAGLIGLFPKNLPRKKEMVKGENDYENCDEDAKVDEKLKYMDEDVQLKDFPTALMRLLTNKLVIFNNISAIFYILGSSSYFTFIGRLMEVQFSRSSHGGTIFTGPVKILGITFGLLTSGYVIKRFKPAPKYLFFWNVIIGLTASSAQLFYTQIGCGGGNQLTTNGSAISCNANCNCDGISYTPVCDRSTNTTYFSPCHAGCKSYDKEANIYRNCTCTNSITTQIESFQSEVLNNRHLNKRSTEDESMVGEMKLVSRNRRQLQTNHVITSQACSDDCSFDFYLYSFVAMIASFISSSGRIGNVLLGLRAVEPRDKSFSQGLSLFLLSLFALIPGPIIFGRIIDSTCLIWNYKCGRRGDCQLFDPIKFRYSLHATSAIFILFGAFFDLLVWYYGRDLDLYGDDESKTAPKEEENEQSPESEPLNK